jgi:hypothetical protein
VLAATGAAHRRFRRHSKTSADILDNGIQRQ